MKILLQILLITILLTQIHFAQTNPSSGTFHQNMFSLQTSKTLVVNLDSLMLDSIIISEMNLKSIPGFASIILKDNKVIWNKNYGYRNRELQLPVEDTTIFLIASTSKTIVATAVMQLWEKNIITLENNINNYLPAGFSVVNPYYPNDTITVKMLMTHTSTLQDNWNILDPLTTCGDSPIKLDSFLVNYLIPGGKYYSSTNFANFHPGTKWNYSDVEIDLLALIVQNLTGKSFAEYCKNNIFTPLSMNSASWFLGGMNVDNIAVPYNGSAPICNQGGPFYPSSFLRINKIDLSKFISAYLNYGTYNNSRILDSTTITYMLSDQLGYPVVPVSTPEWRQGLVWYNWFTLSDQAWGHNGSWYGALSSLMLNPNEKWGYIIFINWRPLNDIFGGKSDIQDYFVRYLHLYGKIYSLKPSVINPYANKGIDSVLFRTEFSNINKHQFIPHLIYVNSDSTVIDSLTLYDDGLHGDLLSNDGIYGVYIPPPQKNEDFYSIGVSSIDNQTSKYFYTPGISGYTTAGPVIVDSLYYILNQSYSRFAFRPYLKNLGNTTSITNPSIKTICNDSIVTGIISNTLSAPTILPGQRVACGGSTNIYYDPSKVKDTVSFNIRFEISSNGYVYWSEDTTVILAITGIEDQSLLPTAFNLKQNFPNPFNPSTTIKYSVPELSKVKLTVFNLLGEEIKTLVDEEKMPGSYELEFNSENIPSGVYFYQIKAGEFTQTKKMILLK
jgi:CubicO group peptidase (beta-lactamase class C family)/uncharacterized lipoprotein YbaY